MGFALALVLLVGAAVAFAGQAFDAGSRRPLNATAPPPPALTVFAPAESITRRSEVDLALVRPPGLRADQAYVVRVYVDGGQVRERELPASDRFELADIPLEQGENAIRVSLVGDGGEGPLSGEVTVVRDDIAPQITVTQPGSRMTVYADSELLRGRTEPGASLTITDARSGAEVDTTVLEDGRFSAAVSLRVGNNQFVLRSADPAGNRASTRVTITRAESSARLSLEIEPSELRLADLPATISMTATVRDDTGQLVDGAEVTFSVSPPNSSTVTYRVTTVDGRARWSDMTLEQGDAIGVWLVTVLATLPSGGELREDGSISLE